MRSLSHNAPEETGNEGLPTPEIVILDQERASLWLTLKLSGAIPTGAEVRVLSSTTWVPELFARAEDGLSPTLIVLGYEIDLDDPFRLLRRLKADAVLRHFPTVMLLPAGRGDLVSLAYESLANAVATEPSTAEGCLRLLRELAAYWFNVVTPYPHGPPGS